VFFKKSIFLWKINFFNILNYFDVLISKIIFLKIKNHCDAFQHEKYFEKQTQLYFQTYLNRLVSQFGKKNLPLPYVGVGFLIKKKWKKEEAIFRLYIYIYIYIYSPRKKTIHFFNKKNPAKEPYHSSLACVCVYIYIYP